MSNLFVSAGADNGADNSLLLPVLARCCRLLGHSPVFETRACRLWRNRVI